MANKRKNSKGSAKRVTTKQVQATENLPPSVLIVPVQLEDDGDQWDSEGLTARQRLFVEHLLGSAGGVQYKAAELAGYRADNRKSLEVQASRVFHKPNVQAAIARELAKRQLTPDDIKGGLITVARASMANFLELNPATEKYEFSLECGARNGALNQIKELKEDLLKIGDGPAVVIKRTVKIHDRVPALATLAKILGMLKDQVEHSGTIGFHPITLDGDRQPADEDDDRDAAPSSRAAPPVPQAAEGDLQPGPIHGDRGDHEGGQDGWLPDLDSDRGMEQGP